MAKVRRGWWLSCQRMLCFPISFSPFSSGHIGCRNVGNKVCRQSAIDVAFCNLYGLLINLHRSLNLKLVVITVSSVSAGKRTLLLYCVNILCDNFLNDAEKCGCLRQGVLQKLSASCKAFPYMQIPTK